MGVNLSPDVVQRIRKMRPTGSLLVIRSRNRGLDAVSRPYGQRGRRSSKEVLEYVYQLKIKSHCLRCPERRPRCLQFHHIDKANKIGNISEWQGDVDSLVEEIKKCIILCANCHAVENGDGYRDVDRPKGIIKCLKK